MTVQLKTPADRSRRTLPPPIDHRDKGDLEIPSECRILICLLGDFRVLKQGHPIKISSGSKTETFLCSLALKQEYCALRDVLLNILWPNMQTPFAAQSLNSLVYSLNKLLGDGAGSAPSVVYDDGSYRLNVQAGVRVDVENFQTLAHAGQERERAGDRSGSMMLYQRAIKLYRGDLRAGADVQAVMERERLRALYLTLLARVADYSFAQGDYAACLESALALLANDPYREDAHRLLMRCYVRNGERAQALRQYKLCEQILRSEFDAAPEPSTRALYDLIRLNPDRV